MPIHVRILRRRFLWALAGLVMFLGHRLWGGPVVQALLDLTGLADTVHYAGAPLGPGQWIGLSIGTLAVMSPAIIGFTLYLVAWIGWPGRPVPRSRETLSSIGLGLGVAVVAFMLVGLMGHYWPISRWRTGMHQFAAMADFTVENAGWIGDMYLGLLWVAIGLYAVTLLAAALLPHDLAPALGWARPRAERRAARADAAPDVMEHPTPTPVATGI